MKTRSTKTFGNGKRGTGNLTRHHVPPRSHGAKFTLKKSWEEHRAYHMVFGNAPTLEACVEILKKYWWTPQVVEEDSPRPVLRNRNRRNSRLHCGSGHRR